MRIETLQLDQWAPVIPVLVDELHLPVPHPIESSIVGAYDGEKLAGFVEVDTPVHFGPLYVYPEYRGRGVHLDLIRYVESRMPEGRNGYIITKDPRIEMICRRRGLRPIEGSLWWRSSNERK